MNTTTAKVPPSSTTTALAPAGPEALGGPMFANTPTTVLLDMNTTYLQEYREDPTEGKLLALKQTVWELEARGAM